jgi:hypothetical protein
LSIDVDGVLNPFAVRRGVVPPGFEEHAIQGYRVLLNRRHGELLMGLADRFELVWATTWEADANREIGARIGLPELPFLEFGDVEPRGAWKTPAIDARPRAARLPGSTTTSAATRRPGPIREQHRRCSCAPIRASALPAGTSMRWNASQQGSDMWFAIR